jgi:hypothetical protein
MISFKINTITIKRRARNSEFGIRNLFLLLAGAFLLLLSGCYDITVRIKSLPANTPPSDQIYISGNFNNWDPGDPAYRLHRNADSVYEVKLPRGVGEVQYKFTRGDWSTVEKDNCGFESPNRGAVYGRDKVVEEVIYSWNDLPKPECPKITIVIDSIPANTPEDAALYFASNYNDWDPGNRLWMFSQGPDGRYYIEVPRPNEEMLEYKVTRGNWGKVECSRNGYDIDNRIFHGKPGETVHIKIRKWKDL